ncbi:MAG: SDR family oxidoreductase [Ferrovibrio sp.]|uniref:SDR family oxidoreductase n=1 Tax=Ferrovibrio sp. TaxID=1917215 RepID=UPI003918E093
MTTLTQPLANKVALVTGGSRSIGAAIVKRLAADGAAVAFTYSASADKAEALAHEIAASGGRALAIRADAGDAAAVQAAVAQTVAALSRIDILVNNAGAAAQGMTGEIPLADFDRLVAVNVKGAFVAAQEAARRMQAGGRIINVGSVHSEYVPYAGIAVYALTKGALAGMTQAMARDLGPRGITVNNILPGPTDTDMNPASGPFADAVRGLTALQRYAAPAEIAGFVAYLAGPDSSFITGANLRVDGGFAA